MNRWIVPLDRRIDYLALHTGQKFMVPFDVIVVFSSNLPPAELLVDEAFLRRLGYKIYIGRSGADGVHRDFPSGLRSDWHPCSEEGVPHVLERHRLESRPLLACLPRDILGQVRDHARFTASARDVEGTARLGMGQLLRQGVNFAAGRGTDIS